MLDNQKIPEEYLDKHGLVQVKNLEPRDFKFHDSLFNEVSQKAYLFKPLITKNKELWVKPRVNSSLMEYLIHESSLNEVSVRVDVIKPIGSEYTSGTASAPVIGISFKKAVQEVRKRNIALSIFHAESIGGTEFDVSGYLVIRLKKATEKEESLITLEAWEGRMVNSTVQYIHAIFPENMNYCNHLDGATTELEEESRRKLFYNGIYKKNPSYYQKQFRLDGKISLKTFYIIIKSYFLFDELTNEYFSEEVSYCLTDLSSGNQQKKYKIPYKA